MEHPHTPTKDEINKIVCHLSDDYRIEIVRFANFLEINGISIFEGKDGMNEGLVVPFEALGPLIAGLEAQRAITPTTPLH